MALSQSVGYFLRPIRNRQRKSHWHEGHGAVSIAKAAFIAQHGGLTFIRYQCRVQRIAIAENTKIAATAESQPKKVPHKWIAAATLGHKARITSRGF